MNARRSAIGRVCQTVPSVAVMGEVTVGSVAPGARLLLTHKSSKLTDMLKVLLCYSNNFMAERIGDSLGGRESVNAASRHRRWEFRQTKFGSHR